VALISSSELAQILGTFGESATIDDGTIVGRTVVGIFDGPFQRAATFADGVGVESYAPRLTLRSLDVSGVVEQLTRVRVSGMDYRVQSVQHDRPDLSGLCSLILAEEN
jgi:hypothetical protein